MPRWLVAVLTASFFVLIVVRHNPPSLHVDVGMPGDQRFLKKFGEPQAGAAGTFRWSQPGARLVFHGASHPSARLVLALDSGPRPVRVQVRQDGLTLGVLEVARGWRSYSLELPAVSALRSAFEPPTVELVADEYLPGADGQRLGVKLADVRLLPHPSSSPGSWARGIPRAGVWTLSLGLLAGWLMRLDALLMRGGRGAQRGVGSLILAALAFAAVLEHRDPYGSAWLYPFLPVTLGLLSLGLLLRPEGDASPGPPDAATLPQPMDLRLALALGAVLVLAVAMRFHLIRDLPWAMWRDEARHAMVGLAILRDPGYRPLYVPQADLPALGLYPFALAVHLWGIHPWSLRPVTALAGALTVLPLFGLARQLTRRDETALAAAGLLSSSSWHVSMSRLSFATIFEPLFTLTGLWMIARSLTADGKAGRSLWGCGGGLCLAVAFQTYHTGRLAPVLAAWLAFVLLRERRGHAAGLLPALLVFAAGVAPVVTYASRHLLEVSSRVGEVSLLARAERSGDAPLAAFDASLGRHLLMFNVRGDANGRHHAPDQPLLDAVTGLGFLLGLALLLRHRRRPESRFLLGALVLTVLPGVLAVDGPQAGRTIGAAAFACLVAAIGWVQVAGSARLPRGALVAPVVVAAALNAWTYFVAMPIDPRVWGASYPVETQMGVFVRGLAETRGVSRLRDVLVPGEVARSEVFRYLTDGLVVQTFEEGEPPPAVPKGSLVLLPGDRGGQPPPVGAFRERGAVPTVFGPPFPGLGTPSFTGFTLERP